MLSTVQKCYQGEVPSPSLSMKSNSVDNFIHCPLSQFKWGGKSWAWW